MRPLHPVPPLDRLVDKKELSKWSGLSPDTISRRQHDGTLTVYKARNGRAVRFMLSKALAELFTAEDQTA